jgi:anti-sigma factor RsiW
MNVPEPCPRIEALSALLDDELSEPTRLAVQAHADECPVCKPVLAEFRQLHVRFAALDSATPDFDLAPEVDRRIDAATSGRREPKPVPTRRPASGRWWQVALLAPGGAVAVAVGLWLGAALPMSAPGAQATAMQMVPFSTVPAGALCPVPQACGGSLR